MSRMTAAQVIGLGEYLEADFDPALLTVSQLLGVLGYHNIPYPSPYSKPKLVQLFNAEIKAKSNKLKKERLKKESSIASEEGIVDGATGQPLRKEPLARRSSRRLSQAPLEDTSSISRPDPPKRRRSSAQPVLGGPSSRKSTLTQAALLEESEPEEELPIKKVGRSKKTSEAAGAHGRRVSATPAEDSGWEDNNIFQSGAESSSPARPSPIRPKGARKSGVPRKSRKSSSAPPQMFPVSPPRLPRLSLESRFSPPQSTFEPQLTTISPNDKLRAPKFTRTSFIPSEVQTPLKIAGRDSSYDELDVIGEDIPEPIKEETSQELRLDGDEERGENEEPVSEGEVSEDQTVAIAQRISEGGQLVPRRRGADVQATPSIVRIMYLILGLAASYVVVNFKLESAPIGYCDTGSNTNNALEDIKSRRLAVEACNRENRTTLYLPPLSMNVSDERKEEGDQTPCPLPLLVPWAHPDTCTPCPDHATCGQYSVTCDLGYLLRPHPLLFFLPATPSPRSNTLSTHSSPTELAWKLISEALDGLPGLGSIALPSRCVEDPRRKRNIGVLGKAIESILGQERGRRLCTGGAAIEEAVKDTDGGDAKKWGLELEILRERMKQTTPRHLLATFDDTFNEAIQQLIQWGGVIIGEDKQNYRYVAHKSPDLSWTCAITVKSREAWAEWRATVFGVALVIISLVYGQARAVQKRKENRHVADLVQIALDTLRHQELAHHTDPVTAPQPYLSSLQLRDLILQDEHSVASRARLWDQVERVVEGNANVRANLQEIAGGDEMRVWRWVGSAGRGPGVKKEDRDE